MSNSFSPSTIWVNASPPMAACTTFSTSATLTPWRAQSWRSISISRLGWPTIWNTPTFSIPLTLIRILATCWPRLSKVCRSVPMILTELAPLTPERASSTLSRMYCEKLKLIPGNFLNFSISSFSMSSRLIVWSQSL